MYQGWILGRVLVVLHHLMLLCLVLSSLSAVNPVTVLAAVDVGPESGDEQRRLASRNRLPTDRSYRTDGPFPNGDPSATEDPQLLPLPEHALPHGWTEQPATPLVEDSLFGAEEEGKSGPGELSAEDLKALRRPRFGYVGEWSPGGTDFGYSSDDLTLRIPTYPIFGPPPPMLTAGFSYTQFDDWQAYDLRDELYDVSLTASWLRRINERWMLRMSAGAAYATDGRNTTSDAWQFRGGVFGLYQQNEAWQWVFGALATGRQDLPVIPAIGAVWQPNEIVRVDLLLPRPRISVLAADIYDGHKVRRLPMFPPSEQHTKLAAQVHRQRWFYLQAGFTGGTWAYERADLSNDLMTYREWRLALGWETVPARAPGQFVALGSTYGFEVAYSFSREFEFDSGAPDISVDDGILIRMIVQP